MGYGWNSKSTTESQHRIDIRWLKKQGYLYSGNRGSIAWSRGEEQTGSISYRMESDRMILHYRHRPHSGEWEDVEQAVLFDRTDCNYGGCRTWFVCPNCSRRVAVLYGAGKYFLCRHCYNLTYASQQENRHDRLMRKVQEVRRRLGGSANLSEPFPWKPKGMHWKTYERLHQEAEDAEAQFFAIFVNYIHGYL